MSNELLHDLIDAWEALPAGSYEPEEIQEWLSVSFAPIIARARVMTKREPKERFMADDPAATEWVVVKHSRFPFPGDEVIGRYPTEADALRALNDATRNGQWFCTYGVEKRVKGG